MIKLTKPSHPKLQLCLTLLHIGYGDADGAKWNLSDVE